jgi:hypothetical protein
MAAIPTSDIANQILHRLSKINVGKRDIALAAYTFSFSSMSSIAKEGC